MAHHAEPMDIDDEGEFDNKENSFHHNNVARATEKGYEELDVSELNMKLRYSFTPASSPMSKSYTANCLDNKSLESDDLNNTAIENNLSQSFNSTITKGDTFVKSPKSLPLQALPSEHFADGTRNSSILRPLDGTVTAVNYDNNVTVTVTGAHDSDENISLPSTSSSPPCTPEATTPIKDVPKPGGSPILRGIKNVLNMFRPSQSPIPTDELDGINVAQEILSPTEESDTSINLKPESVLASTPLAANIRQKEKSSAMKESLVFNDDLEKELRWKDETTIIFSKEKIPIHKLFFQETRPSTSPDNSNATFSSGQDSMAAEVDGNMNTSVEPMDISQNDSVLKDKTMTDTHTAAGLPPSVNELKDITMGTDKDESVFLDCETTFSMSESQLLNATEDNVPIDKITNTEELENSDSIANVSNLTVTNVKLDGDSTKLEDTMSLKSALGDTPKKPFTVAEYIVANKPVTSEDLSLESTQTKLLSLEDTLQHKSLILAEDERTKDSEHQDTNAQTNIVDETVNVKELSTDRIVDNIPDLLSNTIVCPNDLPTLPSDDEFDDAQAKIDTNNILESSKLQVNMTNDNDSTPIVPNVSDKHQNNVNSEHAIEKITHSDIIVVEDHSASVCMSKEINKTQDGLEKAEEITSALSQAEISYQTPSKENGNNEESLNSTVDVISNISDVIAEMSDSKKDDYDFTTSQHNNDDGKPKDVVVKDALSRNNDIETITNCEALNVTTESETLLNMQKQQPTEHNILENVKVADLNISKIVEDNEKCHMNNTQVIIDNSNLCADGPVSVSKEILNLNEVKVTPAESIKPVSETGPDVENLEEELIISETNSPYVSLSAQNDTVSMVDNKFEDITIAEKNDNPYGSLSVKNDTVSMVENKFEDIAIAEKIESPYVSLSAQNEIDSTDIQGSTHIKFEDITVSEKEETSSSPPICSKGHSMDVQDKLQDALEHKQFENKSMLDEANRSSSPPICSKGYNINFDEIENPFASKTKIRLSPPPGVNLDQTFESTNKPGVNTCQQKLNFSSDDPEPVEVISTVEPSQADITESEEKICSNIVMKNILPEVENNTKEPVINVEKTAETEVQLNSQKINESTSGNAVEQDNLSNNLQDVNSTISISDPTTSHHTQKADTNEKIEEEEMNFVKETESLSLASSLDLVAKNTSSSEQSAYYSAGASSSETTEQASIYALPDFDDNNVDPFVTSSKMRSSPITVSDENPFVTKNKMASSPVTSYIHENTESATKDSTHTVDVKPSIEFKSPTDEFNLSMQKDITQNMNSSACSESSKATEEKDTTVREVHTEDEETMEGPFIEAHLESDIGKSCDIESEKVELNDFTDLPVQESDENFEGGEMFIDADAFDFLMNQNKSSEVADNGKESLFLKFDPLFAKRVNSDGIVDALSKIKRRQSTPKKMRPPPPPQDLMYLDKSPTPGPSNVVFAGEDLQTDRIEDCNVTVQKPTMAVPPAVNPEVTPRKKATTPTRTTNRLSMNFTSPAMAVIDKLLSLSGSHSPDNRDNALPQMAREHQESDRALMQLRELLAEKELNVHHLRCESKELKERLGVLETQMTTLEKANDKRLENIKDLNEKLAEKNQINKNMSAVVEEYEKTIAGLIAGIEDDKKRHAEERMLLIKDRDEQTAHLASMENAFSDLHSKYEKCKQIILSYKAKEDTYRNSIKEFEENLLKMQNNYELLKQHATSKLNHANTELEKINRSHESEVLKLNAMIKRKDLHISSLEETLAQKTKANEELTAICDELINKVG